MNVQDILDEAQKSVSIIQETQATAREAIRQRDVLLDACRDIVKFAERMGGDAAADGAAKFAKSAINRCGFDR